MTAEPIHIVTRGRNGRRLFSYPRDYRAYLLLLSRAATRTGCHIHAACLTTKWVHLLVTAPQEDAISALVESANKPYTVLCNATRNARNELFERHPWSADVRGTDQIGATTAYIEQLGVCRAGAASAASYRWSTHRLSIGAADPEPECERLWTPSRWYLSLGKTAAARAARYRELYAGLRAKVLPERDAELARLDQPVAIRRVRPT